MATGQESLASAVFNHLVLPPKLPSAFDGADISLIEDLGSRLAAACRTLRNLCHLNNDPVWDVFQTSVEGTRALNREFLAKEDLVGAFGNLKTNWLALHLTKQNAALLVHRDQSADSVIFEAFEVAAPTAKVLEAKHALTWEFPGRAASIPKDDFDDKSFQNTLSHFLEQASSEAFDKFAARASKGGMTVVETRDSARPTLITEMLMPLLEGIGKPIEVCMVQKRVRDDVVLGSSELPWRRSPYWLLLRVALARILSDVFRDTVPGTDRVHFKFIMCVLLVNFLKDCTGSLGPEQTLMLQAKLCRRLDKLESERLAASGPLQLTYESFFTATADFFKVIVLDSQQQVTNSWENYKTKNLRRIPTLPRRAPNKDLQLLLPNSGTVLSQLLTQNTKVSLKKEDVGPQSLNEATDSQVNELADRAATLVDMEADIMTQLQVAPLADPEQRCTKLSKQLRNYLSMVDDRFGDDALLMSRHLLRLFELWVAMDKAATTACPLLIEYHPVFVPEALDVLCLLTFDELTRLRQVQEYMASRVTSRIVDTASIFFDGRFQISFPQQFIAETPEGKDIMSLGEQINTASELAKVSKGKELAKLMAEYNDLSEAIEDGICRCTRLPDGSKDVRGCTKCFNWRTRNRMRIFAHEAFLPTREEQCATILFELAAPEYLKAYRIATWKLRLLGSRPFPVARNQPALLLQEFVSLMPYLNHDQDFAPFTLASQTKSYLQTHYRGMLLPKTWPDVSLPFAPCFSYFDTEANVWISEVTGVPWYQYLLGSWLPAGVMDPYKNESARLEDMVFPPSSYKIAANAPNCPSDFSVHEFSAFQRIISGRRRRWLVLLVELGATNLNFSNETTSTFLNHIALQAGPIHPDPSALRETHGWFKNEDFCVRLIEQLRCRLDTLVSNRREVFCMSTMVTLTLRLHHLGPRNSRADVHGLLLKIREITSNWIINLRQEVTSATDAEMAQTTATFAFWAALLCRQTFSIYLDTPDTLDALEGHDLLQFFRASIALQENLLITPDALPPLLQGLLLRDSFMSYSMRGIFEKWALQSHSVLEDAINETWTTSDPNSRSYSPWSFVEGQRSLWILSRIASNGSWSTSQTVHYHILQGHLLVDGKPLGRLPSQVRENPSIRDLFQNQHLLARPSELPGMEYQLVSLVNGHQIHIGLRDREVIIQAKFKYSLLEYVPSTVFKGKSDMDGMSDMDLPSGLVDDCVHWLNLDSGMLEIRRKPHIWRSKSSNWILNVPKRVCTRHSGICPHTGSKRPGSRLIEPRSEIGMKVARIFQHFEDVKKLVIFQPLNRCGRLTVEMKRLELKFSVNNNGLLACPQLASEIDRDQNPGALYGLASQIVLRSIVNPSQRSLIVPLGLTYSWDRKGMHVIVKITESNNYARFNIDPLLGRIDCAQEPEILYLKALLHAATSFPLPDELTGRTGTEEAIHCLTSACSQPWTPLSGLSTHLLLLLKSLSPIPKYYPSGLKTYQMIKRDRGLTMTIQHEGLAALAESILQKSQELQMFQLTAAKRVTRNPKDISDKHLSLRSLIRRQIYARICSPSDCLALAEAAQSFPYKPRDRRGYAEGLQVNQVKRPDRLPTLTTLAHLFKTTRDVTEGFQDLQRINIHELLDADILSMWGKVVQTCRSDNSTKYVRLFMLALLALDRNAEGMKLVFWLATIAKNSRLREIGPPEASSFTKFKVFETPSADILTKHILEPQLNYDKTHDTLEILQARSLGAVSRDDFETQQKAEAGEIAKAIAEEWPCAPRTAHELQSRHADSNFDFIVMSLAWQGLELEIERMTHNYQLSCYLKQLQDIVDETLQHEIQPSLETEEEIRHPALGNSTESALTLPEDYYFIVPALETGLARIPYGKPFRDLNLHDDSPMSSVSGLSSPGDTPLDVSSLPKELAILDNIIDTFVQSPNPPRKQYGEDLKSSLWALVRHRQRSASLHQPPQNLDINSHLCLAEQTLSRHAKTITDSLLQGGQCYKWLALGNLMLCLSPVALLEQLRNDNAQQLGPGMKEALVWYGVLITRIQRLRRMQDASLRGDNRRLVEEQNNVGHTNWSPVDRPEWLLLEIDNDLLIRQSQVDVARAIVSPSPSTNSVLQMNMGQGKTSCIMPMAATMLADSTQLCRLIVPRALLLQTALVIQRRIGRLVGRTVQHIPFERRSPKGAEALELYERIHKDTHASGGVMLCLPEHILSFQLSGVQQLADEDSQTAQKMMQIQEWIHTESRDILDESDLTLSPKTQLIYPSGLPVLVDGHPHRWEVVQDLLALVEGHCSLLESKCKGSIQILRRHQGYPIIHFLDGKVVDALNGLLVDDVCEGRLARLQLKNPSDTKGQKAIALIVSGVDASKSTWRMAEAALADDIFGVKCLYLLRGLISERIILLCLKKRWNVQFGLHPDRAPIAVPFEAKGVPSQTAEYGHPDTALVLTCLAFYQTGLSKSQVIQSLNHIIRADDPATQYEHWVQGCEALPARVRHVNLLSVDDDAQMEEVWKCLRFDRHVLNQYMNNFVFPRHAKQFGVKRQASGWDIPLLATDSSSHNESSRSRLTTGFSGTNDNKRLLPETIRQDDLAALVHTNAEVLGCLLEDRNKECYQAVDDFRRHLSEKGLLELLHKQQIRVLIDAGAHILEMENHDLAQAWLDIDHTAQGAVYFDREGRVMVIARFQKSAISLSASSFADSMDQCVVYIDEAHTRGTDLKLPLHAKGVVTLGMGQTKDQTVQAAMRLRQLGSTQSVAFIAPPEVYQSIIDLRPADPKLEDGRPVTSHDVVRWLLEQSCKANEDIMSLHIAQGFDFCRRTNALWKYKNTTRTEGADHELISAMQLREDQSIEELYGPKDTALDMVPTQLDFPKLQAFSSNLQFQRLDLNKYGIKNDSSALGEVEQEREVEFEVEQVREKQKPVAFDPLKFPGLDEYISRFVKTSELDLAGPFIQAFTFVGITNIGRKFGVHDTASKLFVSMEFSKTVKGRPETESIVVVNQRPVEWVLWSASTATALIVIPEEAELLLPRLQSVAESRVWLLSYAAPVTKSMRIFDTLQFFTVPSRKKLDEFPGWLSLELGIIAGKLYFDYAEYKPLLAWLGVQEGSCDVPDSADDASPIVSPIGTDGLSIEKPLKFLLEWLAFRRETQDITHTPMGYVCRRRLLKPDHSFFVTGADESDMIDKMPRCHQTSEQVRDHILDSDDDSDW
ncbi:hypothetical protein EDB81DRAFT_605619, partial [Dactylonectria macrodidyma]